MQGCTTPNAPRARWWGMWGLLSTSTQKNIEFSNGIPIHWQCEALRCNDLIFFEISDLVCLTYCTIISNPCPPVNDNMPTHAHPKPMGMGMGTQCRAPVPMSQAMLSTSHTTLSLDVKLVKFPSPLDNISDLRHLCDVEGFQRYQIPNLLG